MVKIGERFEAALDWAENLSEVLFALSYGMYPSVSDEKLNEYPYWEELLRHCNDCVSELRDQPFLGPTTCALIMDMAMKRLRAQDHISAPKPWVPVIRTLRGMGELAEANLPGSW